MVSGNRTPLFDEYKNLNAKVIDFGGWDLPVQFSSIKEEHHAVRTNVGLFDVSHMGEIEVQGTGAEEFLQTVVTNDVSKLKVGGCQYTAMCYEDGGTVDDFLIYKRSEDNFFLVVNAANTHKDYEWLKTHASADINIVDRSPEYGQLALQGPNAEKVLQTMTTVDLTQIRFFKFREGVDIAGVSALVSRTGYTGEDGFEIYCSWDDTSSLWREILKAGEDVGIQPCGLGARDTLRFEANLALYGQELSEDITPVEAGIGFAVKTEKESDFIGKSRLKWQKQNGPDRKLVGLEMVDKGIPRTGYSVYAEGREIGFVTSGTQSPTLNKNVGLAIVDKNVSELDAVVEVQVRKRRLKAKVVKTPFYKK
ncbi:glycine cleavage system aminomethyltransferase GcvT [Texcoconibacillus texcoconensis]|uniref:glycine cleavage system aminomethyltransferase GcvT n=1 Tax=Texcoconibacillus texcoconensis TaxID=1095777 RepID=UPI001614074F|nr:glycine cleavage system aminomethyltransferase GcvT [Texcoconibacillus texcoconensis]